MEPADTLRRAALESEIRRKLLEDAIARTDGFEKIRDNEKKAASTLAEAQKDAHLKDLEARNEQDPQRKAAKEAAAAQAREKATAAQSELARARQAREEAEKLTSIAQDTALNFGVDSTRLFLDKLLGALTSLGTWVWLALFATLLYLVWTISSDDHALLRVLGESHSARALITLLIVGTTVALAVMLVYQAYNPATTGENYRMAREVFGSLVGIVGTIVGFYFGSITQPASVPPTPAALSVAINAAGDGLAVQSPSTPVPFTWKVIDKQHPGSALREGTERKETTFSIPIDAAWKGRTVFVEVVDSSGTRQVSPEIAIPR